MNTLYKISEFDRFDRFIVFVLQLQRVTRHAQIGGSLLIVVGSSPVPGTSSFAWSTVRVRGRESRNCRLIA